MTEIEMDQDTRFEIAPDQQELDEVPRELRFFSCATENPEILTTEQIAEFNRHGFLTGLTVIDELVMAEHRRYFDDLLQQVMATGGDSYSISTAHLKHGKVFDILTHPSIVGIVRDLLGDDVIGWGSHYFCKMPGDGKAVAWHQDASYWPLSPSKTVTVWLAIDDADLDNGCMQLVSGSHRFGLIQHQSLRHDDSVLDRGISDVQQYGQIVSTPLKAGQISIHADLLVHGSSANTSDRRRCGLTLRYCTSDVRAGMGWNAKGVVVSGSEPSCHWANPPRPHSD